MQGEWSTALKLEKIPFAVATHIVDSPSHIVGNPVTLNIVTTPISPVYPNLIYYNWATLLLPSFHTSNTSIQHSIGLTNYQVRNVRECVGRHPLAIFPSFWQGQ